MKHQLYRATDFADAVRYFLEKQPETPEKETHSDLQLLTHVDKAKLKTKPQIRDFATYERILGGG